MEPVYTIAVLITLAAFFTYVNHRYIKIPASIGLMLLSFVMSLVLIILDGFGIPVRLYADIFVGSINFSKVLLEGMLGLLLFAGALHVNLNDLTRNKLEIGVFATLGVLTSTFIVGYFVYGLSLIMSSLQWKKPKLKHEKICKFR